MLKPSGGVLKKIMDPKNMKSKGTSDFVDRMKAAREGKKKSGGPLTKSMKES